MYSSGHSFQTLNLEYFGVNQPVQNVGTSTNSRHRVAQQRGRLHMNLCLVCNTPFVTERESSKDDGLFCFFNLCNVLQVPSYQEFVPEYHPLCTKCLGAVDEYITLQSKIKELMNKLSEMRKLLGTQLVDSYEGTSISMKNYPVKSKIYKVWHPKIYRGKSKGAVTVESALTSNSQNNNVRECINSENNDVPKTSEQQQQQSENPGLSYNYTLLDISNSVSSNASVHGGVSRAGSVADDVNNENDNSNLSMGCPSPASPPPFDDAPSDHEREVYVKNLNDEAGTNVSNLKIEGNAVVQTTVLDETDIKASLIEVGNSSMTAQIFSQAPQWIDKRRFRPIISTQRRNHPCKFCGKLFPAIFSLQMHERTHTGEKPFKCRICDRGFAAKAAMQKHELTHDKSRYEGEPKYECDLCGKKYHLERSLYTHKRDHMGIKRLKRIRKKYPKKKKQKDPNAPPKIKKPKVKKEGQPKKRPSRRKIKEVKLDEDGNPIPEEPKPKRRKRSPKPPSNRPKRTFLFPRRKPGTPKEPHACQQCGKEFPDRYRLGQHILTHTGEKPLKCPFPECPKTFAIKGNLDKHMKTHDKTRFEGEPAHTCEYCGKGFYVLGTLYHHRRKKHLGFENKYIKYKAQRKEPRQCDICGKQLSSMYAMSHHKLQCHGGEPKFNCEICGKPFYRHCDALDHAKRHEPTWMLKMYFRITCSGCPPEALAFQSKLAIREHWAAAHKDQPLPNVYKKPPKPKRPLKPGHYTCHLCPERNRPTYRHSGSLLKHKKSFHSGKNKKWKPRGKGGSKGTKRRNQSDDEKSTSGESSAEENIDFDKESEKLEKTESRREPTRRSARQTRGNIRNIASLLRDSDNESDEDLNVKVTTPSKTKRLKFASTKGKSNVNVTTNLLRRPTTVSKASIKRASNNVSKLTASYVNGLLGGRYVRVTLTRVDAQSCQDIPGKSTQSQLGTNESSSINVTKSLTEQVAKRQQKPPGKRNIIEATSNNPSVPIVQNVKELEPPIGTGDTEQNANKILLDQINSTSDIKQEELDPEDSAPLCVQTSDPLLPLTTSSNVTMKRPNFSFPMVINNPLAKNKAASPIVISATPTISKSSSKNASKIESVASDSEENETVLGF